MSIQGHTYWLITLCRLCRSARSPGGSTFVVWAWGLLVVLGFVLLLRHQSLAGPTNNVPAAMPDCALSLPRKPGPTLIMFAHPHCPCTRASLQELSNLLVHVGEVPTAQIVFPRYRSLGMEIDAAPIVLWARGMQRAEVVWDDEGKLTARFGAKTSGHVLLYSAEGRLLFSGGITALRGHAGASVGASAILSHLRGESAPATATVFGCSLLSPTPALEPARS